MNIFFIVLTSAVTYLLGLFALIQRKKDGRQEVVSNRLSIVLLTIAFGVGLCLSIMSQIDANNEQKTINGLGLQHAIDSLKEYSKDSTAFVAQFEGLRSVAGQRIFDLNFIRDTVQFRVDLISLTTNCLQIMRSLVTNSYLISKKNLYNRIKASITDFEDLHTRLEYHDQYQLKELSKFYYLPYFTKLRVSWQIFHDKIQNGMQVN